MVAKTMEQNVGTNSELSKSLGESLTTHLVTNIQKVVLRRAIYSVTRQNSLLVTKCDLCKRELANLVIDWRATYCDCNENEDKEGDIWKGKRLSTIVRGKFSIRMRN